MTNETTPLTSTSSSSTSEHHTDPRWWNWRSFFPAFFGAVVGVLTTLVLVQHDSSSTFSPTTTTASTSTTPNLAVPMLGHDHSHSSSHYHHSGGGSSSGMRRYSIDPVDWGREMFSFHQGQLTSGATRALRIAGQVALQADGVTVIAPNDMRGQIHAALANVDALLEGADMKRSDIVKVVLYTTDVALLAENYDVYKNWIDESGEKPPCTAVQIAALFLPSLMIEIDIEAAD